METKVCKKCGIEKPLSEFELRSDTKQYRGSCKECRSKQHKEYYLEHRDEITEKGREYYLNNKEKKKEYLIKNKDIIREKARLYNIKHRDEKKEYNKKYRLEHLEEIKTQKKEYYNKNLENIHASQKKRYEENKDEIIKKTKQYYSNNKEYLNAKHREYYEKHKEELNKKRKEDNYSSQYFQENKRKIYNRIANRKKNDPVYKFKAQIRTLIYVSLKKYHYTKNNRTFEIVGCDYEAFYKHLMDTFFNNYGTEWDGKEEVHIDHIIPLATANSEEEIIKLCHYTNLQLLKAKDNLEKNDKLDWSLSGTEKN